MKITTILLSVAILTGCAAQFDNFEYARLVDMRVATTPTKCQDSSDAQDLANYLISEAEWLTVYSKHLPRNQTTVSMVDALASTASIFASQYQNNPATSQFYCEAQIAVIRDQLDILLQTTARRSR
jgi:hypothetical protein